MIQRIQTIYLALASALAGLLLNGEIVSLVSDSGSIYNLTFKGISKINNGSLEMVEKSLPLTILLFLVPLLFIISIFLFKNRKIQLRVTVMSTLLFVGSLFLMLYYIFVTGNRLEATLVFNIKVTFPLIGAIFGYLAFRAILKDELLVKSYDRIR